LESVIIAKFQEAKKLLDHPILSNEAKKEISDVLNKIDLKGFKQNVSLEEEI
jgi:hypothetical protein